MAKKTITVGYADVREKLEIELPAGEAQPWDAESKLRVVGKKIPRIDGPLKVSGRAKYTFDVQVPKMLYAAVLRSPWPCATIEKIDLRAAEKRPGVKAVIALVKPGDRMLFAG